MLAGGMGLIIGWTDRHDSRNRPLALWLLVMAGAFLLAHPAIIPNRLLSAIFSESLIACAILLGFEWGRRIGSTTPGKRRVVAEILLRVGQGFVLVYWVLLVIYVSIEPELASTDADGFFTVRGLEWAIFAPVLGLAFVFALLAFGLMLTIRMDRAERMRLHVLWASTPFLLGGMVLQDEWIPYSVTIGLLLLLAASIKYLLIQSQRGQFLGQFLSPQVTKMVREQGMQAIDGRRKEILSVVMCDLRGFTAYARNQDSNDVVKLLEDFYVAVGEAAALYDGTIKDHAGDGVLLIVGAPVSVPDHSLQAVRLACELMKRGQAVITAAGLSKEIGLGVGIATGTVTVGAMRGAGHKEYVAVGNPVNLAARLCDHASNGDILSDSRTIDELLGVMPSPSSSSGQNANEPISSGFQAMLPIAFKGFSAPVAYYRFADSVCDYYLSDH